MRTDVLGVGFDNVTLEEAAERGMALLDVPGPHLVATPNPEIVMLCRENEKFRSVLSGASLVLADGIGIIYGAKILGRPLKARVPGIDFASALMAEMAAMVRMVVMAAKADLLTARNLSICTQEN